ncbi:MAG: hypothetical protein HYU66_05655 [Armatimonadetes bacterium]|nr:hypothetical protein [Armatimonadota bacterium]
MAKREQADVAAKMARIRALVTDVDGAVTDGSLYFGAEGESLKVFHVHDSVGVQLARAAGWPVAVITARNTPMTAQWAAELNVERLFQGARSKIPCLEQFAGEFGVQLDEIAYLGDDIWDLAAMEQVGLSAAPADALVPVRQKVDLVLELGGGAGALRELIDRILECQGRTRAVWDAWYATNGVADTAGFLGPGEEETGPKIGFRRCG